MKQYKKKPVIVEAVQWTGNNETEILQFVKDKYYRNFNGQFKNCLFIETLEGDMRANVGDFIIKGINGEFYPCAEDIFNKTYEEVTEK
jgi:hypothetical protein